MTRRLIATLGLAVLTAAGCSAPAPDDRSYLEDISAARAAKDADFRTGAESPVPRDQVSEFLPLSYYPPDPAYAVPASLTLATERMEVKMPTSTGLVRSMERVGALEFTLQGRQLSLGAFVDAGSAGLNRLFVPFSDETSKDETYPAGRYLDIDITPTGFYIVDFNKAYHPYCYYSPTFDCPYPPAENRLPVAIRAGERLPARATAEG
jgi:hypothetical protein